MSVFGLASNVRVRTKGFKGSAPNTPKRILTISEIMHIITLRGGAAMPSIRPVSDLRNHFAEITKEVQTSNEPVFLTKNASLFYGLNGFGLYGSP